MKGSGVDEWPCMKLVWVFKYILVHVYIGVPIKLFFVRKPGGGGRGESKQILREYGFKKTSKITDDPLDHLQHAHSLVSLLVLDVALLVLTLFPPSVFFPSSCLSDRDKLFLMHLEQQLVDFVSDSEKKTARFPPMTSYHRMLVHRVSAYFGLEHNIDSGGKAVVVCKTPATQLPKQRFKEHLLAAEDTASAPPKSILKRVAPETRQAPELASAMSAAEERPTKTIEEREAEYEQRRARIFNQSSSGSATSAQPTSNADTGASQVPQPMLGSKNESKFEKLERPSPQTTPGMTMHTSQSLPRQVHGQLPSMQRQTSAPPTLSSGRPQGSQAPGVRRHSAGPTHLLVTPTSGKLAGGQTPVWR